jgi:hypothetical protein
VSELTVGVDHSSTALSLDRGLIVTRIVFAQVVLTGSVVDGDPANACL